MAGRLRRKDRSLSACQALNLRPPLSANSSRSLRSAQPVGRGIYREYHVKKPCSGCTAEECFPGIDDHRPAIRRFVEQLFTTILIPTK
jgi:hypothetical protein